MNSCSGTNWLKTPSLLISFFIYLFFYHFKTHKGLVFLLYCILLIRQTEYAAMSHFLIRCVLFISTNYKGHFLHSVAAEEAESGYHTGSDILVIMQQTPGAHLERYGRQLFSILLIRNLANKGQQLSLNCI